MTWYETLTSTPALIAGAIGISAALYLRSSSAQPAAADPAPTPAAKAVPSASTSGSKLLPLNKNMSDKPSVMSAPAAALNPPKDDPIPVAQLAQYDGSDPSKPIYVAIKGKIYDVSGKKEMYGKGAGYNVFAGKDASKGLGKVPTEMVTGMSSLDAKDAIADYSTLNEKEMKTLDQWDSFFAKRYNIVGKVVP